MYQLLTASLLVFAASALASPLPASPVALEFHSVRNGPRYGSGNSPRLTRRGVSDNGVSLNSQFNYYTTYIDVGSPAQKIEVAVDTGSFYLWVYSILDQHQGTSQYSPLGSSSSSFLLNPFSAGYGAGTVEGFWYKDTVGADGLNASSFEFGVVASDQLEAIVPGIVGLSPGIQTGDLSDDAYTTLPIALYDQKQIASPAFSIFLQSGGSGGGLILGGVDTEKFEYPFYTFDIISTTEDGSGTPDYVFYAQTVDSFGVNGNVAASGSFPVVFDTGAPACNVPYQFVEGLKSILPDSYNYSSQYGFWYGPASATVDSAAKVDVTIGKLTVNIPLTDLVVPVSYITGGTDIPGVPSDSNAISFVGSTGNYLLGDQFFKNVYAVLDGSNKQIHFATATNNFGSSSVVALPESSGVPSSVPGR